MVHSLQLAETMLCLIEPYIPPAPVCYCPCTQVIEDHQGAQMVRVRPDLRPAASSLVCDYNVPAIKTSGKHAKRCEWNNVV